MDHKIEIIDSHVHLWDPIKTPREVSFLSKLLSFNQNLLEVTAEIIFPGKAKNFFASSKYIIHPYLLENYKNDALSNNVKGIIHVEAGWKEKGTFGPVGETKWLEKINADAPPNILAIIVNANLQAGNKVTSILQEHLKASKLVKGVREILTWQPDKKILNGANSPKLMKDPDWLTGFESLSKFDLSFEATIYDNQIDDLSDLARNYPNQKIMVSHMATPVAVAGKFGDKGKTKSERESIFQIWQDRMAKLAENQNVHLKLSGLAMPICGFGWGKHRKYPSVTEVVDSFSPLIRSAITAFGYNRCVFGSNFPIDKVSLPLSTLLSAYEIIFDGISDDQRHKIFFQNAVDFYGINYTAR